VVVSQGLVPMGPMLADCPASWSRWTVPGRLIVFTLAATSIWCLLAEFYGLCSMRTFTLFIQPIHGGLA
jgi:hypothetical protein